MLENGIKLNIEKSRKKSKKVEKNRKFSKKVLDKVEDICYNNIYKLKKSLEIKIFFIFVISFFYVYNLKFMQEITNILLVIFIFLVKIAWHILLLVLK